MAGIKISALPAVPTAAALTDIFPVVQGGTTYKETLQQVYDLFGTTGSSTSVIADDTATNATMYPVWVTASTGALPLKVSSTKFTFNPSTGVIGTATWGGAVVTETFGGTNQSTYTLGDILYSDASDSLEKLAGNTTTTRKFLSQVGNGAVSAAPTWEVVTGATSFVIADDTTTNATMYPVWVNAATGTVEPKVSSTRLTYNASTGNLTALTGTVTATVGGFVSGNSAAGGVTGSFTAYSTTASMGSVKLQCADNAGDFANVLQNAATAAARTWTLPDATGTIALTSDIPTTVTWALAGAGPISVAVNRGYVVDDAGPTTFNLPATFAVGDIVEVVGTGAGGWVLVPNAGDAINFGSATPATTSVTSANNNDTVRLVGIVADSTWAIVSSVSAGLVLV